MRTTVCCRRFALAVFLLSLCANAWAKMDNLKICVVGNPKVKTTHTTKYCDLLEKSKNSPVACKYEPDRLGCLWAVSNAKTADFAIFEPEDLYFSTLWEENKVLVVGEIKDLKKKKFHYGTVVVVRKSSNITSVKDLAGKRLCHPGLESGPEWPYLFAQYFEERVAPANCEEGFTLYEDRIKTTSDFFGAACKAGPWVADPEEDARLKKLYWNLCALCESRDCRVTEKYRGSGGSITCFKDQVGDVLWAKYEEVKIHIVSDTNAESQYSLLCDDGSLMPVTTNEPCIWLAKPWQVVVANRKSATTVQKILESLKNDVHKDWQENLLHLIELYLQYVENLAVLRTPEDYLRGVPGYLSASAMSEGNCKPNHSVRWCLTSAAEHLKCVWMSQAAAALAIRPSLDCVQKKNVTSCLKSVERMESDVVVVPPDYFADATLKFGLKTFLRETGDHFNDSYLISAVVGKGSNLKNLYDLKGKKACFSRENGIGWNAAVNVLRQENLIQSECEDHEGEQTPEYLEGNVKTICRSHESGNCEWSWSDPSYLMMSSTAPRPKIEEAYSVFYQLGQRFGRNSRKNNGMLKIFGPFLGSKNLLFRDTSTALLPKNRWNHTNNYEQMVDTMKFCSGSSSSVFSWPLTLILSAILVFSF